MNRSVFVWAGVAALAGGVFWGVLAAQVLAEQAGPSALGESQPMEKPTAPQEPTATTPAGLQTLFQNSRKAELAILNALAEKSEAEFIDTPLRDVATFWQQRHKIPIALDRKALEQAGMNIEIPITLQIKEASFRAILEQALASVDLNWTIRAESLWITTANEAANHLVRRVYAVDDLLPGQSEDPKSELEDLIQAITSTVKPESWTDVGGPASIAPLVVQGKGVLVIQQSWPVHLEIMQLLEEIREAVRAKPSEAPKSANPSK